MSITRIDAGRTCRLCGRPLTDPTSRAFRIGPECRKSLTPDQLRAELLAAHQAADPFHVPEPRPASPMARRNNAVARAAVEQASSPETARCHHDGAPGACPMCRQEADPTRAAERIIRQVHDERREHGYDQLIGLRIAAFLRDCARPVARTTPARPVRPAPMAKAPAEPTAEQLPLEIP